MVTEKAGACPVVHLDDGIGICIDANQVVTERADATPSGCETFLAAAAQGAVSALWAISCLVNTIGLVVAWRRVWLALPLENLDQIRNLFLRTRDGDAKAADLLKFGIDHTPFMNLHVVRPAMNYLILNRAQEWLSPGSLERYLQRVENRGTPSLFHRLSLCLEDSQGGTVAIYTDNPMTGAISLYVVCSHPSVRYSPLHYHLDGMIVLFSFIL